MGYLLEEKYVRLRLMDLVMLPSQALVDGCRVSLAPTLVDAAGLPE